MGVTVAGSRWAEAGSAVSRATATVANRVRRMPQSSQKLDAAPPCGVKKVHLEWSDDLLVYVLLLRALREPLRQRSVHVPVDDHVVI